MIRLVDAYLTDTPAQTSYVCLHTQMHEYEISQDSCLYSFTQVDKSRDCNQETWDIHATRFGLGHGQGEYVFREPFANLLRYFGKIF